MAVKVIWIETVFSSRMENTLASYHWLTACFMEVDWQLLQVLVCLPVCCGENEHASLKDLLHGTWRTQSLWHSPARLPSERGSTLVRGMLVIAAVCTCHVPGRFTCFMCNLPRTLPTVTELVSGRAWLLDPGLSDCRLYILSTMLSENWKQEWLKFYFS